MLNGFVQPGCGISPVAKLRPESFIGFGPAVFQGADSGMAYSITNCSAGAHCLNDSAFCSSSGSQFLGW